MLGIMLSGDAKPRDRISAGKALLAAEAQNQADEHKAVDVSLRTEHDRLDAIARDLGLEVGLVEAAEGQSSGGDSSVETTADAANLR
jgi:phosphosulfolactate synthase (CoM biosynthesis protein A)